MDIKNEVLYRIYFLLFAVLVPLAGVLMYRTIDIAILQGDRWRSLSENNYVERRAIEAERGNIYARDGSLLATSVPHGLRGGAGLAVFVACGGRYLG